MADKKEIVSLIDKYVTTPEGMKPEKLHIFFDKKTRTHVDQYQTALLVARNIPFNIQTITVSDPLVLVTANVFRIKDGEQARRQAMQYYEKWTNDALKHAWTMAVLTDNEFEGEPMDWDDDPMPPPGVPIIPEPKLNLQNPTERRLKQIVDLIDQSRELQLEVQTAVNNALVELVNDDEDVDPDEKTGFQPEPTDSGVHDEVSSDNNNHRTRPRKSAKADKV